MLDDDTHCEDSSFIFNSFVTESDELVNLVDNYNPELCYDRLSSIKYQEYPQLLNPYVTKIINALMSRVCSYIMGFPDLDSKLSQIEFLTFKLIYLICKVRGYKSIMIKFPSAIEFLEPVLLHLEKILVFRNNMNVSSPQLKTKYWEIEYALLIWLNIISMNPFDLNLVDTTSSGDENIKIRILRVGNYHLSEPEITRVAASQLLSTILTRVDMKDHLDQFLKDALKILQSSLNFTDHKSTYLITGTYQTLGYIFEKGNRDNLLNYVESFFKFYVNTYGNNTSKLSKIDKVFVVKLLKKLALVLLISYTPSWKHERKIKILFKSSDEVSKENSFEENYCIPEETEEYINHFLLFLKDENSLVRIAAAKGIAEIADRLPKVLADELVQSLLHNFSNTETESTSHGTCLSIANFIQRGLLLPNKLPILIPKIEEALVFEKKRGNTSSGYVVRDAACFVVWSIARTYDGCLLESYSQSLSCYLLITSIFDKESNCRKAAAAAYQEHFGRNGLFPHGFEIIKICNFYTLSNRSKCYLELAPKIASYMEYNKAFIDHLYLVKSRSNDLNVRELTAKSLAKILPSNPEYFILNVIPYFISNSADSDLSIKHGSIISLSEIIISFSDFGILEKLESISENMKSQIASIPSQVEKSQSHKIRYSECIRIAVNRMIEAISKINMNLSLTPMELNINNRKSRFKNLKYTTNKSSKEVLNNNFIDIITVLNENIKSVSEKVQLSTIPAYKTFLSKYYSNIIDFELILEDWISKIKNDPNPILKRGLILLMGNLPEPIYKLNLDKIIDVLNGAIKIIGNENPLDDVEMRKNAAISIKALVLNYEADKFSHDQLKSIFTSLLDGMDDYFVDHRGDIGSTVRESAIISIKSLLDSTNKKVPSGLFDDLVLLFVKKLTRIIVEKIDRTREIAGLTLQDTIENYQFSQDFEYLSCCKKFSKSIEKYEISLKSNCQFQKLKGDKLNWAMPSVVFDLALSKWLNYSIFSKWILIGTVKSIGATTNKELVDIASSTLIRSCQHFVKKGRHDTIKNIKSIFVELFKNSTDENFQNYLIRTLNILFESECIYKYISYNYNEKENDNSEIELFFLAKNLIKNRLSITRSNILMNFFSLFLYFPENEDPKKNLKMESMSILLFLLGNKYPVVRRNCAETIFNQIQIEPNIILNLKKSNQSKYTNEDLKTIKEILINTKWDSEHFQEARLRLCSFLELNLSNI